MNGSSQVERRLAEAGITIPDVVPPVASYQPAVVVENPDGGGTVYVSGQLPLVEGSLPLTGKVGAEVTEEQAFDLARRCGVNLIAALKHALQDYDGGLDRITRIAKVGGFVASASDFTGQPRVINGTSELLGEAFGDAGQHARSAVGVNVLPLDTPVEVDLIAHFA
ncbi:RidA family protein [Nesterenkonia cremea]|uniref:LysR family transcriptional regulator n=1 Tax=Nesterenkonia cremea TaxID=1882340 RepID=A0A917AUF7_9MICC|nr:RidA family protein [Nesterenkonia cremea]GGE75356.1 LysR family transcriptional regulator [Nesterenkonia cremea]